MGNKQRKKIKNNIKAFLEENSKNTPKGLPVYSFGYSESNGVRWMSDAVSYIVCKRTQTTLKEICEFAWHFSGGKCFYCEKDLFNPDTEEFTVEWDHLHPSSLMGLFIHGNVVASCPSCNSSKSDTLINEFLKNKKDIKNINKINKNLIILKNIYENYNIFNVVKVKDKIRNHEKTMIEYLRVINNFDLVNSNTLNYILEESNNKRNSYLSVDTAELRKKYSDYDIYDYSLKLEEIFLKNSKTSGAVRRKRNKIKMLIQKKFGIEKSLDNLTDKELWLLILDFEKMLDLSANCQYTEDEIILKDFGFEKAHTENQRTFNCFKIMIEILKQKNYLEVRNKFREEFSTDF